MAFELDERLKDWVGGVVPGAELSLAPPSAKNTGQGVGLYLLEVRQSPPPSTTKRVPLQIALRYLVTTWSEEPEGAHQMVVELMFSAMENKDFEVELEPIPLTLWSLFGTPPLPSFILRMPLRHERPQPQAKYVRELKVQTSPIIGFHGVLLGPGDLPLSDCRVEMPALNLATGTDYKGRFYFPSVPSAGSKQLVVKAKGYELPVNSEQNYPDSGAPLVIRFSPLEE